MAHEHVSDPSRLDGDPLELPEDVKWRNINWSSALPIVAIHVLALLAFIPLFFSWSALGVAFLTWYFCAGWGINICYHRLLTHRSFETPRWFERFLTLLAFCNAEGSSLWWVATHRRHHQHSDKRPDPHSPLVNFFWSHVGWLLIHNPAIEGANVYDTTGDLQKDPLHTWMHKGHRWLLVWFAHVALIFFAGFAIGYFDGGLADAVVLGTSFVVWGVFVRMVAVWHITWSVNSITHMFGYQTHKTGSDARNTPGLFIITMGEALHNHHHHDPCCASNQRRWWEIDPTYYTILVFGLVGLAKKIKGPNRRSQSLGTQ